MKLDKTFITNTTALFLAVISYKFDGLFASVLLYTGLFALSGSLTNQLAIHMLFEKVPFLYGSGVILDRFEAFKDSIKNLMMNQFFTIEQLDNFFKTEEKKIDLTPIIEDTDFSVAFDALSATVMDSTFGGMIGMFGGKAVLETLRAPFTEKMKSAVITIVKSDDFNKTLQNHMQKSSLSVDVIKSIETVIDARLNELTPLMVKDMVQKLIKDHLSWLVVWGGVFGGAIGLISASLL